MNLIDTNVILRFLTADKSAKYKGVYELFSDLEDGRAKVEIKPIVFFQTIFVLKSFYKVEKKTICEIMDDILNLQGIFITKKNVYKRVLELYKEYNIEIVDCFLLSSLEEKPDLSIISYDRDFDKFNIKRIEP
jgi:predicted nucleic-acid-binding protein